MYETNRMVQLLHFVSGVRFLAGVRLVFVTSFRIRLFRTWAVHTKGGDIGLVRTGFIHMFRKPGVTKKTRKIIHVLKRDQSHLSSSVSCLEWLAKLPNIFIMWPLRYGVSNKNLSKRGEVWRMAVRTLCIRELTCFDKMEPPRSEMDVK